VLRQQITTRLRNPHAHTTHTAGRAHARRNSYNCIDIHPCRLRHTVLCALHCDSIAHGLCHVSVLGALLGLGHGFWVSVPISRQPPHAAVECHEPPRRLSRQCPPPRPRGPACVASIPCSMVPIPAVSNETTHSQRPMRGVPGRPSHTLALLHAASAFTV